MAQFSSQFPTALDDSTSLGDPRNNAQSTLANSITSAATSLTLASASAFPSAGAVSIDSEVIYYTGKSGNNLTGLLRGQESTTAASHTSGRAVRLAITQGYHLALRAAVIALQTKIGIGDSAPSGSSGVLCRTGSGTTEWRDPEDIPGIAVNTGSDPNAVKTNTASEQATLGALDANNPTKTATQINALTAGRMGRRIYDSTNKRWMEDFGSSVGFRHATPEYNAYEIGIKPGDSDSAVRTANSAAWAAWLAALPAGGGTLAFPEGVFYFATELTTTKTVHVKGAGRAFVAGDSTPGTTLVVESGQNGFEFLTGSKMSSVSDLLIKTRSGNSPATGDGIYSDVPIDVQRVSIESFGRDGVFLNGTAANSDLSSLSFVDSWGNRRDGFHFDGGDDTNVIFTTRLNATNNGRHGIYDAGFCNVHVVPHVAFSGQITNVSTTASGAITGSGSPQSITLASVTGITVGMYLTINPGGAITARETVKVTALPGSNQITAVITRSQSSGVSVVESRKDYFVNGGSNEFIRPYSEHGGGTVPYFFLGPDSTYNTMRTGVFGAPTVEFALSPAAAFTGHDIWVAGKQNEIYLGDAAFGNYSASHDYRIRSGNFNFANELIISDATDAVTVLSYNPSGTLMSFPNLATQGILRETGTPQALSGAGAVNLTTAITHWTTTGADAGTLADGAQGQIKKIILIADGGDGTLTPTNAGGYTTITFNDVGDTVTLQFTNGKWYVLSSYGVTIA